MGRRVTVGMILFIILLAVVKAHMHFIRLLILAAAGLGGLYMLHLLAQDYNKIRQPVKPAMGAGAAPAVRAIARLLFRRSVDGLPPPPPLAAHAPLHPWHHDLTGMNEIPDLDYVLEQDPKECARMVVCELATKSRGKLLEDERAILDFLSAPGATPGLATTPAAVRRSSTPRRWGDVGGTAGAARTNTASAPTRRGRCSNYSALPEFVLVAGRPPPLPSPTTSPSQLPPPILLLLSAFRLPVVELASASCRVLSRDCASLGEQSWNYFSCLVTLARDWCTCY